MKKLEINIILKRVLWILLGFSLAGLSISAVQHKKEMYTSGLEVEILLLEGGDNLITRDDIAQEVMEVFGPVEQILIKDLDVKLMEQVLLENPFMKEVAVYIDAHHKVHVSVAQREPMVRIMDLREGNYYLDREGVKIPVSPHYTVRVPIANGHLPKMKELRVSEESHEVIRSLFHIAQTIHADNFLSSLIDQVYVNESKQIILIPKVGVKRIVVGDSAELTDKVDRLKIFYKEVIPDFAWEKYDQLDLRFEGQVVCK
jgi:cell division protein FtsQ